VAGAPRASGRRLGRQVSALSAATATAYGQHPVVAVFGLAFVPCEWLATVVADLRSAVVKPQSRACRTAPAQTYRTALAATCWTALASADGAIGQWWRRRRPGRPRRRHIASRFLQLLHESVPLFLQVEGQRGPIKTRPKPVNIRIEQPPLWAPVLLKRRAERRLAHAGDVRRLPDFQRFVYGAAMPGYFPDLPPVNSLARHSTTLVMRGPLLDPDPLRGRLRLDPLPCVRDLHSSKSRRGAQGAGHSRRAPAAARPRRAARRGSDGLPRVRGRISLLAPSRQPSRPLLPSHYAPRRAWTVARQHTPWAPRQSFTSKRPRSVQGEQTAQGSPPSSVGPLPPAYAFTSPLVQRCESFQGRQFHQAPRRSTWNQMRGRPVR
jgi:hypothetical protein